MTIAAATRVDDPRYQALRRTDGDITFVAFPFAPAATPDKAGKTWILPNPDDYYKPLKRTEGYINQGWQPVLTPGWRQQNPDEPRYVQLRRQAVDDLPQFTEFPFAPARTPDRPGLTWFWPNPDDYYKPQRRTEGYNVQGWQPVLTPAINQPNPDDPRYVPHRRQPVDDCPVQGWQPVLTPVIYQSWPDDPRYKPLRRQAVDDTPQFTEFPGPPAATPDQSGNMWWWPNPDEYYKPLKRTAAETLNTLAVPPALTPDIPGYTWILPNPDDPRYVPLRKTPDDLSLGWQPVLTPARWQQWPDDPRYVPLKRTEGYINQGWQPVLTPVTLAPWPDYTTYVQLKRTEGYNTQGWQPVLTPAVNQPWPDDPRYNPIRRLSEYPPPVQGWQPVLTPVSYEQNPDTPRYVQLRRQAVDDLPQFTAFPGAPASTPDTPGRTWWMFNPDIPRHVPLRRTDADTLWVYGLTQPPPKIALLPDIPRYASLRRQPVDDIPQFTEFPYAPAQTPDTPSSTWILPNPDDPRYSPLKKTEGFINQGWQPVLTPGIYQPNPDFQNYFAPLPWVRYWSHEEAFVFNPPQTILYPQPDETKYHPLRRQAVDDYPEFTEFPFSATPTPDTPGNTWILPNPDDPRYVPLRATKGDIAVGGQPVITPITLVRWPNDPIYAPPRRTEGYNVQGWQPVLTPITYQQNPADPIYAPLRRTDGQHSSVLLVATTPITLSPWPEDPRYRPLRRTEGYTTQGWQPVLTPSAFSLGPDVPRYVQLRRTEGYINQGWQPVLTPGWRQQWPDDPRYAPLRRTEGYNTQGWQPVLTPSYWISSPDFTRWARLKSTEGQISQSWVRDQVPSFLWWGPNDPRYVIPRRTEGLTGPSIAPPPAQTPDRPGFTWILPNPDDPKYIPIRRTDGDWSAGYQLPGLTPNYYWFNPNELRYVPLRRTDDALIQGWQSVLTPSYWVQASDDTPYDRLFVPHWFTETDQPYQPIAFMPVLPAQLPPRQYRFPYPLGSVLRAGIGSLARSGGG